MYPSPLLKGEEDMMLVCLNLSENIKKREQRISLRYGDQQVREVYIDFLSWGQANERKRSSEGVPGGHNPPGRARHA